MLSGSSVHASIPLRRRVPVTPASKWILSILAFLAATGTAMAEDIRKFETYDLYLGTADGTRLERLTNDVLIESRPSWSPDGRRLLYSAADSGGSTLFVYDLETEEREVLEIEGGPHYDPCWSPDGTKIAYVSQRRCGLTLCIADHDGANPKCILPTLKGSPFSPRWSPDGKRIAFSYYHEHDEEPGFFTTNVRLVDSNGTNLRNLQPDNTRYVRPDWSKDGKRILCNSHESFDPDRKWEDPPFIWTPAIYDVEGGTKEVLFSPILCGSGEDVSRRFDMNSMPMPTFLPENKGIALTLHGTNAQSDSGACGIPIPYLRRWDGTELVRYFDLYTPIPRQYSLHSATFSPDGAKVACLSAPCGGRTSSARRLAERYFETSCGTLIGSVIFGAHGELVFMLHVIQASLCRVGDTLRILNRSRDFFRIDEGGQVHVVGSPDFLPSQALLPEKWPYRDEENRLAAPSAGTVLFKRHASLERAVRPTEPCFVMTSDYYLVRISTAAGLPPNLVILRKRPGGHALVLDGPDWSGDYAFIHNNRRVEFMDKVWRPEESHELRWWPYVTEQGGLTVPPAGYGIWCKLDARMLLIVTPDGLMETRMQPKESLNGSRQTTNEEEGIATKGT